MDSGAGNQFDSLWDLSDLHRLVQLTKTVSKEDNFMSDNIVIALSMVCITVAFLIKPDFPSLNGPDLMLSAVSGLLMSFGLIYGSLTLLNAVKR